MYCRLVFLLLLSLITGLSPLANAKPVGAVCVLNVDNKLLLMQDRLSHHFGLPGGYIEAGEPPSAAAIRELKEETGLNGRILFELQGEPQPSATRETRTYACQSLDPVIWQPASQEISLLKAPNLGGEIMSAKLVDPHNPEVPLRFAEQIASLAKPGKLATIAQSPQHPVPSFAPEANALHQSELIQIARWQSQSQSLAPLWALTNKLGEGRTYLLFLPLLLPLIGWGRFCRILSALLVVNILVQIGKFAIASPRPFHFEPELARQAAMGFGMPSGHTALATLALGLLAQLLFPRHPWRYGAVALLAALLTGAARVFYGVHFISDVVVGTLLGLVLLVLWSKPHWLKDELLTSRRLWWGIALLALPGTLYWQDPLQASSLFAALGIALGLLLPVNRSVSDYSLPVFGSCLLLTLPLPWLAQYLARGVTDSMQLLVAQFATYLLIGFWLGGGIWAVAALLESKTATAEEGGSA